MIEWIIIIVLLLAMGVAAHIFRNMWKTLHNIQARLHILYIFVEEYNELVKKVNESETYYGDTTIEAFVKMSNELGDNLKVILDLQKELTGELHGEEEEN
jgi:NTP pyrophosphatase (non-canonical NTP hydrolase)